MKEKKLISHILVFSSLWRIAKNKLGYLRKAVSRHLKVVV
jgi:hypothetical protein